MLDNKQFSRKVSFSFQLLLIIKKLFSKICIIVIEQPINNAVNEMKYFLLIFLPTVLVQIF